MPVVPQPDASGNVRELGFVFNYATAFTTECIRQGVNYGTVEAEIVAQVSTNTNNISTTKTSLGVPSDSVLTTAWGKANEAFILATNAHGATSVPSGTWPSQGLVWDGAAWVLNDMAIKLGRFAGESNQQGYTVAIGAEAGRYSQQPLSLACGFQAGNSNQGVNAIAIGNHAGYTNQGTSAIAIGTHAGDTQSENSIILNATGAVLNNTERDTFTVKPIRANSGNLSWLTYDTTTGEINSDTAPALSLGASNDTASLTGSVWAYAKQAEEDAQSALTSFTTLTTPNSPEQVGTYTDTVDSLWGQHNSLSSSFYAQFVPNVFAGIGTVNDIPSFTTSLWAYAKDANETGLKARDEASNANTFNSNYTTPNAIGVAGNSGDTPSLATSLWAYAKQAEADAQSALNKTSFSNTTFTTVFTPFVRSLDGSSFIAIPDSGNTLSVATFNNAITISAGEPTGGGTLMPLTLIGSHLVVQSDGARGVAGQVLGSDGNGNTVWQGVPGNVGNSTDAASLTDTLWAYAKQAEIDAQTALIPNTSLQAAIRIIPFSNITPSPLVWTSSSVATINVPLAASTANTCLAPIAPADNINGWRFSKI